MAEEKQKVKTMFWVNNGEESKLIHRRERVEAFLVENPGWVYGRGPKSFPDMTARERKIRKQQKIEQALYDGTYKGPERLFLASATVRQQPKQFGKGAVQVEQHRLVRSVSMQNAAKKFVDYFTAMNNSEVEYIVMNVVVNPEIT